VFGLVAEGRVVRPTNWGRAVTPISLCDSPLLFYFFAGQSVGGLGERERKTALSSLYRLLRLSGPSETCRLLVRRACENASRN